MVKLNIRQISETHFMIYEQNEINPEVRDKISNIVSHIESYKHPAILSVTSSYRSIMVAFEATTYTYETLIKELNLQNINFESDSGKKSKKVITLPVVYGEQYGPDLNIVAEHSQLTKEEVIKLHSDENYLIYAIGFLPGFPFLGGLNKQLYTPRKETPRSKIKSGSVGIANNQTGLYPKESPGGWQIIGRTPIDVFNLERNPMILYEAGDYISFKAIEEQEFQEIEREIESGKFDYSRLVGELN